MLGPVSTSSDPAVATTPTEEEIVRLRAELDKLRRALHATRESHERNLRALCAIADGIAIVDTAGRITCLNSVASHLTGWKENACLGRRLANVVQFTDHHGRARDVLSEGFASAPGAIVSLVRRDGHVILVDGAVAQVHGQDKRVLGAVVTFRNVTASTRMTRELAYHANHDALTGLHNRRAFQAQLQRAIGNASEFRTGNALLYLDLDQFKAVNDSGGHLAGDELLRQLAILLRRQLRDHDTVARLGGDEFAVLVEQCTPADATIVAEKIRNAVVDFAFAWDGGEYRIGTSIGVVHFDDGERAVEELLEDADRMCYVAKDGGRNRVAMLASEGNDAFAGGLDVSHRPGARREA